MLCLQPGVFVVVRGRRSAAVVLIRLDRRGVRHIKDTLGTLHTDALESSFDLHPRRIDDLRLVHKLHRHLVGTINARTGLRRNAGAVSTHVATINALAVLKQTDEHFGSAVKDRLDIRRGDGRLIRHEFDKLLELHIRMQVDCRVPKRFAGLAESGLSFDCFNLNHNELNYLVIKHFTISI